MRVNELSKQIGKSNKEVLQRTWTKPPLITENILQSKRRRIVKQVWDRTGKYKGNRWKI